MFIKKGYLLKTQANPGYIDIVEANIFDVNRINNLISSADICINLEVGVAGDYSYMTEDEAQEKLGFGPSIFLHDNSMLPDKRLRSYIEKIASDNNIKLQYEILAGYGEDGSMFQKSRGGIPAINLGIPTRYLHCHNSVIDLEDYRNGINLGIYEVAPEDLALCEFICTSKIEVQSIIRYGLDLVRKENN